MLNDESLPKLVDVCVTTASTSTATATTSTTASAATTATETDCDSLENDWILIDAVEDEDDDDDSYFVFGATTERSFALADAFDASHRSQQRPRGRRRRGSLPHVVHRRRARSAITIERTHVASWPVLSAPNDGNVVMPTPTPVANAPSTQRAAPAPSREQRELSQAIALSRVDIARVANQQYLQSVGISSAALAQLLTRELTPEDYELLSLLDNRFVLDDSCLSLYTIL